MAHPLVVRWGPRAHLLVYRLSNGRVAGRIGDAPVLLLMTTGRRSGRTRTVPLFHLADGSRLVVVASNGGADRHPAWLWNLRRDARARVRIGRSERQVVAREASDEERAGYWPHLSAMYANFDKYAAMTRRRIQVVILEPV